MYTETTIEVAPTGFEAPYVIALVDLGEARVLARASEEVDVGDAVGLDGTVENERTHAPLFEPL